MVRARGGPAAAELGPRQLGCGRQTGAHTKVVPPGIDSQASIEPAKLREAIAKTDFHCLYGHVKFGANGQISLPQTVVQIQAGEVVPIYGEGFLNKPRYPLPPWDKR